MSEFLLGGHIDNRQDVPGSSFDRVRLMRAKVAVTLATSATFHGADVYRALKDAGAERVCIRVGDETLVSSGTWMSGARSAYTEARGSFPDDAIDFQALNECNLTPGLEPEQLAELLLIIRHTWLASGPKCRLLVTPLSMGVPGWEGYFARLMRGLGAEPFDAIAAHPYAHNSRNLGPLLDVGLPVVITEFSHPGLAGEARARWTIGEARRWAEQGIEYAGQFIVDGQSFGQWDEGYRMSDDEARALGNRGAIQIQERSMIQIRGIDISNNNEVVDLARAKAAGYEFVVIKIAEDDLGDDDFFDTFAGANLAQARALEMGVGVYTFIRPSKSSPSESVTLIERALARIGGLRGGEFVAIDCEDEKYQGDLHVWLAEALALGARALGQPIWKYSADWYTSEHNLEHPDLATAPTWWASYQEQLPEPQVGWGPIRMWQNSVLGPGAVPGVVGQCDVNIFYGTLDELRATGKPAEGPVEEPSVPVEPPAPRPLDMVGAALDNVFDLTLDPGPNDEARRISAQAAINVLKSALGKDAA